MTKITNKRSAGPDHQVVTVVSEKTGNKLYRRKPCKKCPWRKDAVGEFPAEAFRHSANTAYDMATHLFGCHDSGTDKPATCAGFLLRGAEHNLQVRLDKMSGKYQDVSDCGHELHAGYREMAMANGVPGSDPILENCR